MTPAVEEHAVKNKSIIFTRHALHPLRSASRQERELRLVLHDP
ncbi:MAG: hypothetical protein ACTSVI_00950 [Promethearchaeota archaeon]